LGNGKIAQKLDTFKPGCVPANALCGSAQSAASGESFGVPRLPGIGPSDSRPSWLGAGLCPQP